MKEQFSWGKELPEKIQAVRPAIIESYGKEVSEVADILAVLKACLNFGIFNHIVKSLAQSVDEKTWQENAWVQILGGGNENFPDDVIKEAKRHIKSEE